MNWTIKYFNESVETQILELPDGLKELEIGLKRLKEVKKNDS